MIPQWVPPPRYLLRRHCILRLLRDVRPCRVLEIGCGAGDLLATLAARGYSGLGLELSPEAAAVAERVLAPYRERVSVQVADFQQVTGRFGVVLAFDVLEHIRDDEEALSSWASRIAPDGKLLLSVPAHRRRWDWSDVSVGHYRRYEKGELVELVQRCGLEIEEFWCYGFPLSNVIARVTDRLFYRRRATLTPEASARTQASGLLEASDARMLRFLAPQLAMLPFAWLQMLFVASDLGTGYILRARPRPSVPS